jgi:hypothetical protein
MIKQKAALRARSKRKKYFVVLAREHPDRFEDEWVKRVDSWLLWIKDHAGKVDKEQGGIASVFSVIDEALLILEQCGDEFYAKYGPPALDVLVGQCCVSLSREVIPQILKYKHRRFPEM